MLYSLRIYGLLAAAALCGGCAGVSPNLLRIPATPTTLTLPKAFTYDVDYKLSNASVRWSIAAGAYTAIREDDSGTYYQGPRECFSSMVTAAGWAYKEDFVGKVVRTSCGIYIPNDPVKPAKVYATAAPAERALGVNAPTTQDSATTVDVTGIVHQAAPNATPLQAGVGGAIAFALAEALAEAEMRNLQFVSEQPNGTALRAALVRN